MFIECLQSHLAVCAQPDLPSWAKMDRGFWNLISIREPERPQIDKCGFKQIHSAIFHDVLGTDGIKADSGVIVPRSEHFREIFSFADSVAGEPILVHCWAGISRSTAVALGLLVRAMHFDGFEIDEIEREAPEILLAIRSQAVPNPLVLQLALEEFLPAPDASDLMKGLINHPTFFSNKFPGASPGE